MAKVIKLTDNSAVTLLPITDSAYVQHKWKEGETGGTTVTSVRDALNNVIDRVDGVHASGSDNQHLSASAAENVATISLNGNGGSVKISNNGASSAGSKDAHVAITYSTTAGIQLKVSYTDTNTDHYDKLTKAYTEGLKIFSVATGGTATGSNTGDYYVPIATASGLGVVKSVTTGNTDGRDYNVEVKADGTMKVNVPWKDYDNVLSGAMHMKGGTDKGPASNVAYKDGDTYIYNPTNATVTYTIPAALSINGAAQVLTKGDMFTYSESAKKWTVLENNNEVATSSTLGLVKSVKTGTTSGRDYAVEVKSDGTMKVNVPWTDDTATFEGHYSPVDEVEVSQTGSVGLGGTFKEISYAFDGKGHKTQQITKTWTVVAPSTQTVIKSATFSNNMKYAELKTNAEDINETWLKTVTGLANSVNSNSYVAVSSHSTSTCTAYVKTT